jgi:sugar lactone lactonase YvrE
MHLSSPNARCCVAGALVAALVAAPVVALASAAKAPLRHATTQAAARSAGLVFVSDLDSNAVWLCPTGNVRGGILTPPVNQLNGVSDPVQLAVDAQGTVYVANAQVDASGSGSVTEYPRGSVSPSRTLTTGLNTSTGVAVDSSGTVYVSNKFSASIAVFSAGASAPATTITANLVGPDGLAVDASDDLFIADGSGLDVLELQHGSQTPRPLHLQGLTQPTGVAVDRHGDVYVSNLNAGDSNVQVYAPGATKPRHTLSVPGPPFGSQPSLAQPMMLSIADGDVLMVSSPLSLVEAQGEWGGYASAIIGYLTGSILPRWAAYGIDASDAVFQPAS